MVPAPSENPAERAMLISVRIWLWWPLVCLVFCLASSPFGPQIRVTNSLSQWIFFLLGSAVALVPLRMLLIAAWAAMRAMAQKEHRLQGTIAFLMVSLAGLIMFPSIS